MHEDNCRTFDKIQGFMKQAIRHNNNTSFRLTLRGSSQPPLISGKKEGAHRSISPVIAFNHKITTADTAFVLNGY